MNMKKRILLAYCMYGNGHRAIAEYIEKYFKEQDQELEIMAIDLLKYSLPILGKASQKATDFFLLRFPMGWSFIYDLFDNKLNSAYATKISLQLFKNKRMRKVITDFDPDLVISTHFYGSSLIDYYNRKGITNCRLITVVTDYETQAMWLKGYKDEDAIVVADKDEVGYLVYKGVEKNKIKPIGIPIHPVSSPTFDMNKYRKKLGFSGTRPICLFFGGGGNGGTHSLPYIKKLIKGYLDLDIIYIAGRNTKAKARVDKWVKVYEVDNVKTFGFVKNVPELLQICDFVVSKPGGAQTTESLYFKKPVIMINCSGGQERANYKFFVRNGFGRMFKTPTGFFKYIKLISEQPSIIARMKKNMSHNNNDKAMEKLYTITKKILKKEKEKKKEYDRD